MRSFKVNGINCQNCANTIKNYLKDEFGEVEVDVKNKVVSLNLTDDKLEYFYSELDDIGFEVEQEIG